VDTHKMQTVILQKNNILIVKLNIKNFYRLQSWCCC